MGSTIRSIARSIVVGGVIPVAMVGAACIDPKSDYDDWLSQTADVRGPTPVETSDAPFEAAPPDGGFTQLYFMACLSQLADDSLKDVTSLVATATYNPSTSGGGGGTIDFSDTALQASATSLTQVVDTPRSETAVPVAADGTFSIDFGADLIPGAANPLMTGDVQFSDLTLNFQLGPGDALCANASGAFETPIAEPLQPHQNICVFVPMASMSTPIPTITQSQVHCP